MGWWRRAVEPPVGWEDLAGARLAPFATLDADEWAQLGADIGRLLGEKRWEAARGFALTARAAESLKVILLPGR